MDEQLLKILGLNSDEPNDIRELEGLALNVENVERGELEIESDSSVRRYTLKPLKELYGSGTGANSVDPVDDQFMPLFVAIEGAIAGYYESENPGLTDGTLALSLDRLGMDPDAPADHDVTRRVQMALRLCLSLNDYSRQEVRTALRRVQRSVKRHAELQGPRGYLNFIAEYFGSGGE